MISPLVRRQRLATELIRLRNEHAYSSARLAAEIGVSRQRISELENGNVVPNLDLLGKVLRLFDITEQQQRQIMTIADEARERGWWATYAEEMGTRQALYANLEAGASEIREYQMVYLPGLLQIPSYTEVRVLTDRADGATYSHTRALEARAGRQQVLERPGGPTYEVVIDELAIRRFAAPAPVIIDQLDHLVHAGHERQNVTIRVLPLAARIHQHAVPRTAFFTYRYPDPNDPVVVAVDTVTDDLVLTEEPGVRRYLELYGKLQDASLSAADSLDFLAATAEEIRRNRNE
ncbi:helix-turn-helix domain-containing protein [Catellatospora citrea]|uniref:Transcriptional regulator n=1 Tax=Catellatospora citrea TaxID=53366 RepID=A0A8J3P5B0_9ACTN|nr:Scr1 family TA system antitoxin-like transcriptional regulator [Catellatospora citrea]RKE07908.1 DNA-binding XRE family transcriptional regulator [Catellatospora citrea]GIG02081.1 transcriptional regulator [Catellatospora citrea]